MEYGLWNFHGGFWNGGNGGFPPVEAIPRNFYAAVNTDTESPTFHITTHSNGNSNLFSNISSTQPCPTSICTNLEYLSLKQISSINGRIPSVTIPGHSDDILQSVALESVPLTSEVITEPNSMDNFAPSDSPIPGLLSQQQNHNSNFSSSDGSINNITSATIAITTTTITIAAAKKTTSTATTTINTTFTNTIPTTTASNININNNKIGIIDNPSGKDSKNENKIRLTNNEEIWGDISGQETNIKLENNPTIDYFFQHSYQNPVYEVVFSKLSSINKKEAGTSDETDEEDELEVNASQIRAVDSIQNTSHPKPNGSPILQPMPNAATVNFSKSGYECEECGLILDTRTRLKKHLIFHLNANSDLRLSNSFVKKVSASSKCPMSSCRFRSSERAEMEAHVSRHITGENKLNPMKKSGSLTPQRVRYEREEYRCQICAYSCTVEKAFHKHLKIHSVGRQMNQIKISCVICGKDRSSEMDMNKHMKKHRDDRYFCCDICIFKTVQLKKLIQHRRMHTGEKPHLCPHCSYRSARRDNLRSHVRRVHKKDNLFCDTFSPRSLLVTEDLHNPVTMPPTPISPETFTTQTPLDD